MPHHKTSHLKKLGTLEQTKQGIFVRLNVAWKEPMMLYAIRGEGNREVRKSQAEKARLQLIYT